MNRLRVSNSVMNLRIGYLYGDLMNTYGDQGNITCLTKRCQWRGIKIETNIVTIGSKLNKGDFDLYFFGGGQDQAQVKVASDIESSGKGKIIKQEAERGVPILAICGGYQLLGDYYLPHQGPRLTGVGLFPAYTVASSDRMIGNIIVDSSWLMVHGPETESMNCELPAKRSMNYIVGFENHSGKTYLKPGVEPLGKVIKGFGNNGEDQTEGCIFKNSIGCYIHGSLLPKNPLLADWIIQKASVVKYGKKIELKPLDDSLELKAHDFIISKIKFINK